MRNDEPIRPGQPAEAPEEDGLVSPVPRLSLRAKIAAGVVVLLLALIFFLGGEPLNYLEKLIQGVFWLRVVYLPLIIEGVFLYFTWVACYLMLYRFVRQNELLYVLVGAAEAKQPLLSALMAYSHDRPSSPFRHFVDAVLLSAVFPGFWFWHHWLGFDAKVKRLVHLLDTGMPLSAALRSVPGVAARETVLAATVGEKTGKLGPTLKQLPKWRLATIWIDLLPRLVYPLCILLACVLVVSFLCIYIIPYYEEIFKSHRTRLPEITVHFMDLTKWFVKYWFIDLVLFFGVVWLFVFSSTLRWYLPVVGRVSRLQAQSRVLKMLGLLLQAGQPVPQALRVLLGSGYFRGLVRRRLLAVYEEVEQGGNLASALHRRGLLPGSMTPLVHSAQKMNNVPWALEELGDHLAQSAATKAHRFCMAFFPIVIILLAILIGFIALALFYPLVALIEVNNQLRK